MRLVALLTLALAAPLLRAGDPPLKVPCPDGTLHTPLVVSAGKKASVFFFVSPYCPTATTFAPEMKKIAADYAKQADFYFVHSDPDQKTEDILQHTVLNDIQSPVLLDKDQRLARFFTARITPETVVFSSEGKVVYQGRINDLYLGPHEAPAQGHHPGPPRRARCPHRLQARRPRKDRSLRLQNQRHEVSTNIGRCRLAIGRTTSAS